MRKTPLTFTLAPLSLALTPGTLSHKTKTLSAFPEQFSLKLEGFIGPVPRFSTPATSTVLPVQTVGSVRSSLIVTIANGLGGETRAQPTTINAINAKNRKIYVLPIPST